MASTVIYYCTSIFVLLLVIVSTYGRVAVPETVLSNEISKEDVESKSQEKALFIINSNESIAITVKDSTNVIDLEVNLTLHSNRNCSDRVTDVNENIEKPIQPDIIDPCTPVQKVDNGTALLLTPFIEDGRIEDGRKAAEVNPELFLGVKSYSGFFTVNKTYNSNTFFWYFPVQDKPVNETPWLVWLQGGPGASSLTGLFDEIGPFRLNRQGNLARNPFTWLQNQSLLFIDNPVGTGYSFTNHKDGLTSDMATYTKHLYNALRQFLQLFPELRTVPLVIAGESYAGKYIPALGMEIHRRKKFPGGDINLKGLIIGNAYVEPDTIAQITRPFYHFGLLVKEQVQMVQPLVDAFRQDIAAGRSVEAKQKWNTLVTVLLTLSHQQQAYNFLQDSLAAGKYERFLHKSEVKRAIHVGDIKFSFVNLTVNIALAPDFLSNTKATFEALLNHYDVLAYCGQLDQMLSCAVASEHYRKWKWEESAEFLNATRYPLLFRGRLAGYYQGGGRFTEVMVRGAGHMAAMDAPAPMQWLVAQWTHSHPLPKPPVFNETMLLQFISNQTHVYYL